MSILYKVGKYWMPDCLPIQERCQTASLVYIAVALCMLVLTIFIVRKSSHVGVRLLGFLIFLNGRVLSRICFFALSWTDLSKEPFFIIRVQYFLVAMSDFFLMGVFIVLLSVMKRIILLKAKSSYQTLRFYDRLFIGLLSLVTTIHLASNLVIFIMIHYLPVTIVDGET